ncbi:MAG: ABC transporter permease, partial [Acidobacteria bacterium]|nr:ABC transporter permease [Acidobacteriota bacterium]
MGRVSAALRGFATRLVSNANLLRQLAVRAFRARHAGAVLGWAWPFLNTGVQLALYCVVFSKMIGIRLAEGSRVGFGLYLMVGLVPYIAISDGLTRSVTLFRANRTLIQRVRFPAEVLVLGELGGTLLHHGLALLVVAVVCAVAGVVSIAGAPWLVLGLALALLWMVGLSLLLAVAGAVLPDIGEILGLSLLVVFYGAPIVYP